MRSVGRGISMMFRNPTMLFGEGAPEAPGSAVRRGCRLSAKTGCCSRGGDEADGWDESWRTIFSFASDIRLASSCLSIDDETGEGVGIGRSKIGVGSGVPAGLNSGADSAL